MYKLHEESRKQFEEWWENFYETSPRETWSAIYSPEHDYYCDQDIDGQYDAWKASRACIGVELPKSYPVSDGMLEGEMMLVRDVVEVLRYLGLSVSNQGFTNEIE